MGEYFSEILEIKKKYSEKFGHRLEMDICSDVGEWKVSFGMEGWSCLLVDVTADSLEDAMTSAIFELTVEMEKL